MDGQTREVGAQELEVDGVNVFLRRVEGEGVPTVFVHGNPTHSADWMPFLRTIEGPALALDLPGFGRSARPPTDRFDYSMHGLGAFLGRVLDIAGVDAHKLVCHDWGAVGLITAQSRPGRVRKLVIINAVPLLPGYRWHAIARYFWRVRGAGEVFNALASRFALKQISRWSNAAPGPMPEEFVDMVWEGVPKGTWPQVLALYRSGDPPALAAAGRDLGRLDCPALVVWGTGDPYLPASFAAGYAERLPHAKLLELDDAGHWPWIDRPDLVGHVNAFLAG